MLELTDAQKEVLRLAWAHGRMIHEWGDGASREAINELVELKLLKLRKNWSTTTNQIFELTSMGVQESRRLVFEARKQ
jgi:hypothetical protein